MKPLHTGAKILIVFIVVSVVWFSVLNFVSVTYFRKTLEGILLDKLSVTIRQYKQNTACVPEYIVATDKHIPEKSLTLLTEESVNGTRTYFYVKRIYFEDKIKDFAIIVFGIESSLFLSLILITYLIVSRFVRESENSGRFLNLLLLSFNHKIGNFLSILKVNIEILRENPCEKRATERLFSTTEKIEADLKRTFKMLREKGKTVNENVNLRDCIFEATDFFALSETKTVFHLNVIPIIISSNSNDIGDVLYNLIDNAVKYSSGSVNIRLSADARFAYVFIRNELAVNSLRGTGLGLEITNNILKRCNGKLVSRQKGQHYIAYVRFPR
ncbi:sensor histidine kinase [Candidatus Magnetomonas plexicatena]|uniref:sensor histidine kinase n=1 Tax=Candidatus Magnetomonas plexicatena TaxID=2552947 RepID=UPI001C7522CD|nr:HAMP domain-containing histidine kinase [Nitrospirales bacterium LBB_01]